MAAKIRDMKQRFMQDVPFRDLVIRCAGTFLNLVLVIFNAVLAQAQNSLWNHAMASYFAVLTIMGSIVAVCVGHSERIPARRILAINGILFIALAIALGVLMGVCVGQRERVRLPEVAMILMAAFTFGTTVVAVIDATKIHNGTTLQQVIARVSIASSIGALLVLEIQMLTERVRGSLNLNLEDIDLKNIDLAGAAGPALMKLLQSLENTAELPTKAVEVLDMLEKGQIKVRGDLGFEDKGLHELSHLMRDSTIAVMAMVLFVTPYRSPGAAL